MYQTVFQVKDTLCDPLQLSFANYIEESESSDYSACDFSINGKSIKFRSSKITPKKAGQFVTLWKRSADGIVTPYHKSDYFQFVMIFVQMASQKGLFLFPKTLLAEKKIISHNTLEGKRGFRIYPPWDETSNNQATQAQAWQVKYFVELKDDMSTTRNLLEQIGLLNTLSSDSYRMTNRV